MSIIISIGINNYDFFKTLSCSVSDSVDMVDYFKTKSSNPEIIHLFSEAKDEMRPSFDNIKNIIKNIKNIVKEPKKPIFFYFAGHGFTKNGRDYLVMEDTKLNDIEKTSIKTDDIITAFAESISENPVLIIDACRDNYTRDLGLFGERTIELAKRKGVVVFFGCSPGEICNELPNISNNGNGVFTYALLQALKTLEAAIPISIDRKVNEMVRQIVNNNKLSPQHPYTSVSPIQKATLDIFTNEYFTMESKGTHKCFLIIGPSDSGKSTLGRYISSKFGFTHIEMSNFVWNKFDE